MRVIANRSSGRQGFAIAAAAAEAGARVTLVAGPVALDTPPGVDRVDVETAEQMADAVFAALPADAAILVAAVADWRVEPSPTKLKKGDGPPKLKFVPTRDILAELGASAAAARGCWSASPPRPRAWSSMRSPSSIAKRADWIVANDVSGDVMGGHRNRVHLVTADGRRGLARSEQGRGRAASDRARRAGARLSRRPCSPGPAGCGSRASSSFSPSNRWSLPA